MRDWQSQILQVSVENFNALALEVFAYQYEHCEVYRQYLNHLSFDSSKVVDFKQIPYLPIAFFKQQKVITTDYSPEAVFESSSTTGIGVSKHYVKSLEWYQKVFTHCFEAQFGPHQNYAHLALLPNYLERSNSSLVYQVNHFIQSSLDLGSQFYLKDLEALILRLKYNLEHAIPTILWGVSFALLDFAETQPLDIGPFNVIETGGMKGRRKEITRVELHGILQTGFKTNRISTEYGMTELMSQAYALTDGRLVCPPWMRVMLREINDPFASLGHHQHGAINIIDLANIDSCAFIETSDLGKSYPDNSFEVLGRMDYSDTRGCSLMFS